MELFQDFLLLESEKSAKKEAMHAVKCINLAYNEWKKIKRRRNAVNIITTSINKITTIEPSTLEFIHQAARLKLAVVLVRCLDVPHWMSVEKKRNIYRRAFKLLDYLQKDIPNTGTGGNLREVVMTRLSASICYNTDDESSKVFVAYEPNVSKEYLKYLFGDEIPEKTFKMQSLPLPEDFDTLCDILKANHQKACEKYYNKDLL